MFGVLNLFHLNFFLHTGNVTSISLCVFFIIS